MDTLHESYLVTTVKAWKSQKKKILLNSLNQYKIYIFKIV
jgi:hypothetical protein